MLNKLLRTSLFPLGMLLCLPNLYAEEPQNALENTSTEATAQSQQLNSNETRTPPTNMEEAQPGDTIYVSEAANIWIRTCPKLNCGIEGTIHVGDEVKFLKLSEDKKFTLIETGEGLKKWTLTRDLQTTPCGKALVSELEGKIAELKNDLENYDSEAATNYRAAKAKLEKLEKENAALKNQITAQNSKIEELDATRRDYADKLETKELDMQMRWWLQGASIAFCGALVGILFIYIPKPKRKKNINRF